MTNSVTIKDKIGKFNRVLSISGDKSLSIRWVLFSSLASGLSKANNLLMSEDVLAAIKSIRKFGIKSKINNKECKIYGKGLEGYNYKKKYYN